ncbi:MAG: twin-arginine translocase TatA/TatE family subunit [Solirubrobacterales bacterium]|nr:twin-arginine translocase TatA/TatE family subunit [Solirubrobacterales bacterium]
MTTSSTASRQASSASSCSSRRTRTPLGARSPTRGQSSAGGSDSGSASVRPRPDGSPPSAERPATGDTSRLFAPPITHAAKTPPTLNPQSPLLTNILQPTHLLVVLIVALLFLGPRRLPEAGRALGQGLKEFRNSISGEHEDRNAAATARTAHPEDPLLGEEPATATQAPELTTASTTPPAAPG